jgi:phosphinothricin acetyltransferase
VTLVRPVTPGDAGAVADIYAPIVRDTAISFEMEPPDVEMIADRIAGLTANYPWLVLEVEGGVGGYAYAGPFKDRPACRWTVETTIYLDERLRGQGLATMLYSALIDELVGAGFATAFAGITRPNPASEALHASSGYRLIGVFPRAGFKLGEWHDVGWWHRPLADIPNPL